MPLLELMDVLTYRITGPLLQIEHWHNKLSTGKSVTVLQYLRFQSSLFTAELTNDEKEQLLKQDKIDLNELSSLTFEESWHGGYDSTEIEGKEGFSEEEIEEIMELAGECGEMLEENEWDLCDTFFELTDGCELELSEE